MCLSEFRVYWWVNILILLIGVFVSEQPHLLSRDIDGKVHSGCKSGNTDQNVCSTFPYILLRMTFLIAVCAVLLALLYSWINIKPKKFPPGPPCLPLVGSALFMPRKFSHLTMSGIWMKKYGPIVGLTFGPRKVLTVSGPKEVFEVLRRDEFQGRPTSLNLQARSFNKRLGVIFTDGSYWVELRRFTLRHLRDFGFGKRSMETFILQEIEDLIKDMRDKDIIQVYDLFKISALNVLWGMMAGKRYERNDEELQDLLQRMDKVFRSGTPTGGFANMFPVLKYLPDTWTGLGEFMKSVRNIQSFMRKTIKEHEVSVDENDPRDFIDSYLIEMKKLNSVENSNFTDEGLIVTCQDFFAAGGETTNGTMAFCLLYMVLYPRVQASVQQELDTLLGRRRPSIEDKGRLHYVNAVLTEVARINPVVPMAVPHRVVTDTVLNDYVIPKDTMVLINFWSLFHDRDHWGDPEVFRPERFLDERGNFIKDDWVISFGTGKRMCLGEVLARNAVFLFFTTLLQEFNFSVPDCEPQPSTVPLPGMTLTPQPFNVKITRRS